MAAEQDTPEVAAIVSRIESWLDAHQNKIDLDLTSTPIEFKQHSDTLFTGSRDQVAITLGFSEGGIQTEHSLDQLRSAFSFIALDRLPVPGLQGVPSQWQIYPQTPMSSFTEGVTLEKYDPTTQILQLRVQTQFFAIYGTVPQKHPLADAPSPRGTYLQVRRDIQGDIRVQAKLVFTA